MSSVEDVEFRMGNQACHNPGIGGFGFALPHGRGVGGRVIAYGEPIVPNDYRNSPCRDSIVSDVVDSEELRTGLALPIRAMSESRPQGPVAAVLYAMRRTVTPFSLAERLNRLWRTLCTAYLRYP